ncbi:hypothetical protein FLJU110815_19865 [Flavobacterium jumunjinense]
MSKNKEGEFILIYVSFKKDSYGKVNEVCSWH